MSTSAPGRVKTILVVDLTHMLNDPFATTILAYLRARLIPPTGRCQVERAGVFIRKSVVVSAIDGAKP